MSSRFEHERRIVQERMSPLRHHSMNQKKMGLAMSGEEQINPSRKVLRSRRRQHHQEIKERMRSEPFDQVIFERSIDSARKGEATPYHVDYLEQFLDELNNYM